MIEITRRSALLGALASFFVPSFSAAKQASEVPYVTPYVDVFKALPRIAVPASTPDNAFMTFFLRTKYDSDSPISLEIIKSPVLLDREASMDDLDMLLQSVETVTCNNIEELPFIVNKMSSSIARETRRGRGNHIAYTDEGLIIWYQGSSVFDTPFQVAEGTEQIIPNRNSTSYFRKIKIDYSKFTRQEVENQISRLTESLPTYTVV